MPHLTLSELESVIVSYQHTIREAINYPDVAKSSIVINNARRLLQKWFAERDIELELK